MNTNLYQLPYGKETQLRVVTDLSPKILQGSGFKVFCSASEALSAI